MILQSKSETRWPHLLTAHVKFENRHTNKAIKEKDGISPGYFCVFMCSIINAYKLPNWKSLLICHNHPHIRAADVDLSPPEMRYFPFHPPPPNFLNLILEYTTIHVGDHTCNHTNAFININALEFCFSQFDPFQSMNSKLHILQSPKHRWAARALSVLRIAFSSLERVLRMFFGWQKSFDATTLMMFYRMGWCYF